MYVHADTLMYTQTHICIHNILHAYCMLRMQIHVYTEELWTTSTYVMYVYVLYAHMHTYTCMHRLTPGKIHWYTIYS